MAGCHALLRSMYQIPHRRGGHYKSIANAYFASQTQINSVLSRPHPSVHHHHYSIMSEIAKGPGFLPHKKMIGEEVVVSFLFVCFISLWNAPQTQKRVLYLLRRYMQLLLRTVESSYGRGRVNRLTKTALQKTVQKSRKSKPCQLHVFKHP